MSPNSEEALLRQMDSLRTDTRGDEDVYLDFTCNKCRHRVGNLLLKPCFHFNLCVQCFVEQALAKCHQCNSVRSPNTDY